MQGHAGIPGNERADHLAGKAAEQLAWSQNISLAYLKLKASEMYNQDKAAWHQDSGHHSGVEILPPPPKSCLGARDAIAHITTQIQTDY